MEMATTLQSAMNAHNVGQLAGGGGSKSSILYEKVLLVVHMSKVCESEVPRTN